MDHRRFFFASFSVLMFASTALGAEIVSVTPTGSVKKVQQVVVKFSAEMVPMGDPRSKKDPMTLSCGAAGGKLTSDEEESGEEKKSMTPTFVARWVDSKTWSLDFPAPLSSGVRCSLKVATGASDLAGKPVSGEPEYVFSTGGPALMGIAPRYGEIEPGQYFVLLVEGDVDEASLVRGAHFESEGVVTPIGVDIVKASPARDDVIRAAIRDNWDWNRFRKYADLEKPIASIPELKNFLVLSARNRFSEGRQVTLHWTKGIKSKSGLSVEEPQEIPFRVMEMFTARFECDRVNADRPCNPILDMRLNFTNRLKISDLKGTKLVGPKGQTILPEELSKGDQNKNASGAVGTPKAATGFDVISNFEDKQVSGLTFKAPFPQKTKFKLVLPAGLKDEIGRPLDNRSNFPLEVGTDEYSPLVKFAAPFGLLESQAEPALPVSLRNVEKSLPGFKADFEGKEFVLGASATPKEVIEMYQDLLEKDSYSKRGESLIEGKNSRTKSFQLPKPGASGDFELVGIPMKSNGLHVVEIRSAKLGAALLEGGDMYVASGALVTNLGVHFKRGRESSLVWVTQLSDGKPVAGADVGLYNEKGEELAKGKTDAAGITRFGVITDKSCGSARYGCTIFAFAKKADDYSFVSTQWTRGIEDYRFNLRREYLAPEWGPIVAHTVMDRAILQAGEKINMKHFIREHSQSGFRALDPKRLPKRVLIVHSGSRKVYPLPFEYDKATGTALSSFTIPKDAALGVYEIYLSNKVQLPKKESAEEDPFDWSAKSTGNFLVSEYRLPLMESNVKILGTPLLRPTDVKVDLSANYLSGGPASGLTVKVRATLDEENFVPDIPGANDFTFFSEPVKVGTYENDQRRTADSKFMFNGSFALGKDGGAKVAIDKIPSVRNIKALVVEMEYKDPNGEMKTASARQPIFPSDAIIGLATESWFQKPGTTTVKGVIVNRAGKPLVGHPYVVDGFRQDYVTHRKRLVGGFYSYDSKTRTTAAGTLCKGKTDEKGRFTCEAKSLPPGSMVLQAKAGDSKSRTTYSTVSVSILGDGDNWYTPSDSDRIDVLPEKTKYEPGETAKVVVRSPFPKSTVLVTVEREGVLDAFTKEITREQPTVEIPIKDNYSPNMFVSVLALRGRAGEPMPTALVDLGRPSMKLGMTEVKVGWKAHELKVSTTTDKKKYRTREVANVTVKVASASGRPLPAGSEVTVVAFDEALSRLRKNWSLDLLQALMGQRGLEVDTSSAQNQVIGKRHFGMKAKPPGGGGGGSEAGAENSRELFDPLLTWQPKVKLDAKGEAQVKVPLNDSITSFQIVAVAHGALDLFGTGATRVSASKDLIIYSGVAPVVREGDKIDNTITLRNTTEKPMSVDFKIVSPQIAKIEAPAKVELKANEAQTITVPMTIPADIKSLELEVLAKDATSGVTDGLKTKVRVDEAVPIRVLQATLFQLEKPQSISVQQPKDAIPNRGGVDVAAQETLVRGLAGVKSYMMDYPYTCLEQKVSQAIALENKELIATVVAGLPSYMDSNGLLKFFPTSIFGWEQLNRYVLDILQANDVAIPEETQSRLLDALARWLDGRLRYRSWWTDMVRDNFADQERVLVMATLSRNDRFEAKQLSTIKQTPNLWATATVVAWLRLLDKETSIENRDTLRQQAEQILHARMNLQGTSMTLQGELPWDAEWLLFTSGDQEALDVFGVAVDHAGFKDDVGRMARGVLARTKAGHWDTTLANAWGVTHMRKFSQIFEKDKVGGETSVTVQGAAQVFDWSKQPTGSQKALAWPKGSETGPVALAFAHKGSGKPWVMLKTRSAIPLKAPWDLGYTVKRSISPVSQKVAGKWSSGDVANVQLSITAKYDQPWVVVRDPIPGGSSILGAGLEDTSQILDRDPVAKRTVDETRRWPTEYEEKSLSHFASYSAYLPKGTYKLNYRVRLNAAGDFKLPPTRVEAMYSPETFGELPNANWSVAR